MKMLRSFFFTKQISITVEGFSKNASVLRDFACWNYGRDLVPSAFDGTELCLFLFVDGNGNLFFHHPNSKSHQTKGFLTTKVLFIQDRRFLFFLKNFFKKWGFEQKTFLFFSYGQRPYKKNQKVFCSNPHFLNKVFQKK